MITCPQCGADTSVLETRRQPTYARRRRVCRNTKCGAKVTTVEVVLHGASHHANTDVVMVRRGDIDRLFEIASRMVAFPSAGQDKD